MWVIIMWLDLLRDYGSETRTHPGYINGICGAHSLWWDTILSLDTGEVWELGSASTWYTDFFDFPREALPSLRSE